MICRVRVLVGLGRAGAAQGAVQGDHTDQADTTQSPGHAMRHRSVRAGVLLPLHHARCASFCEDNLFLNAIKE